MTVRVSINSSFRLFTFDVPFKRLFAPTYKSWMSKNLRDSESLGKINGKKVSQIEKPLLKKGVKSPRQKKLFWGKFFVTEQDCLGIGATNSNSTIHTGQKILCLPYAEFSSLL